MFTAGAILFGVVLGFISYQINKGDRSTYGRAVDTPDGLLALHVRQELRLVAFLLAAVIVMLGVIADRIH
jgi:hypothetical protein